MWYFHRYNSHRGALKIADKQKREAEKKGTEFQIKYDVRPQDTTFLLAATDQLIAVSAFNRCISRLIRMQNRRVLMFSYVYGYFISETKETAEKNLFEFLQENLEKNTNYLSELYERPVERIEDYHAFMKWKEEVANYTRVSNKVCFFLSSC